AIIAILASLLLPALARGKALAAATKCKSNLHQIGIALGMYLLDNAGAYPAPTHAGSDTPSWETVLAAYVSSKERDWMNAVSTVFQCPTHKALLTAFTTNIFLHHPSYGYNWVGNSRNRQAKSEILGLGGVLGTPDGFTMFVHPTRE